MIGVEEKLLQAPRVAQDVVGDARQGAVTLVNVFHLPVTALKNRNAAEHGIFTNSLFTLDHVKTAPNIIVPWAKRSRARAPLFAHTSIRRARFSRPTRL